MMYVPMKSRRGEIATTLTLISLLLAGIGTLVGARVTVQQRQQTQTLAAGASGCGMSCSKNSDCMRSVTNSSGEEVTLACDMRVKKCLAASGERDRCDDVSGGGGSGGNCGVDCRNDRDCNNTDATDSSIRLHCDFTIGRAAGRGRCQGFPNGKQCPNIPTPTSRFAGGGTTGGSGGLSPIPSGFRLPSGDPFPTGALRGGTPGPTFVATTQAPQTGGGTSSSPQGNRFSTAALRCGGTFRVEIDPVIDRILIRGGSGQSYVLGNADEVSGSDTGRRSPVGYRMWMSFSRQQIDNIKVDFSEGVQRNGRSSCLSRST
ncbi:MAG: hypothetical protein UZ21_OP11001000415 [Microgenomates bacterium OLB22]|nr:MAG: hypothetical protein UZ21_OP11001000415 [Microgenomates bacterium OLB22]